MAPKRMSFKEDNRIKDPRECIGRLVHEFVSGHPLDENLLADYSRCRKDAQKPDQTELDRICDQVKEAYLLRERYQRGKVRSSEYATATAPLLEYQSRIGKKAA